MSTGGARTGNEAWCRAQTVYDTSQLGTFYLRKRFKSIADELARKDAELAELRKLLERVADYDPASKAAFSKWQRLKADCIAALERVQ